MILESDPRIGHASSMSSATPAAFLSAMSMTTTSASCLSASPRATVAPTLPAPPTTVTLRFISISWLKALHHGGHGGHRGTQLTKGLTSASFVSSVVESLLHVADDSVRELRRLQLDGAL